jgi:predicted dehydrogenase
MTKFLIAGYGSIGRRHFHNLLSLGEKDILFLRSGHSTLQDDELRGYTVETGLEKALAHKPDAVIVANPTALHLQTAIPAAEAGCTLLLEKPVSHTLDGLDELEAALKRGGGRALVGYQFRFHPVLGRIRQMLEEKTLGQPLSARAHWGEYLPDWHPWEDYRQSYSARADLGGGVVVTLSHPLDYLRWFFGGTQTVSAQVGNLSSLELAVEDYAEITLGFPSVQASLHLDYYQRPPRHQLEIICEEGTIRWDNADGSARVWSVKSGQWQTIAPPEGFERNDLFLAELRHFREVIAGKSEPLCTLADGRAAIELCQAVYESSRTGKRLELSVQGA